MCNRVFWRRCQLRAMGINMALVTRIDARSEQNNSLKFLNDDGEVIAEIVVIPSNYASNSEKARNEANLQITSTSAVTIVKGNGKILGSK